MNDIIVKPFNLTEKYRADLEELLFQLSGKERTLSLTNYPNTFAVGAFDAGRLIGFAQLFILHKTTFIFAHLEDVIVHSDYRRQGIAKRIMEEIVSLAKSKNADRINLTVRKEREAAISLYEELGFISQETKVYRLEI